MVKKYGKTRKRLTDRNVLFHATVRRALLFFLFLSVILTTAAQTLSPQQLMEKGDSCRHVWKYKNALMFYQQAYDVAAAAEDTEMQFLLLERIMRCHDVLRHWKEMPESSYRLYTLAKEQGDSARIAMALFMRGKRMNLLHMRKKGIQICLDAVEQMKRTDYPHKNHELAHFYAILTRLYCNDGQYDDAWKTSQQQEYYVNLAKKSHSAEWYQINMQRVNMLRVALLGKMGRTAEADSIYRLHHSNSQTDPMYGDLLLEYLQQRKMNDEALQFFQTAMQNIREDGDTIGRNMQRLMNDMGDTYYDMGEYEKAAMYYREVTVLADTLAARSLSNLTGEVQKAIDNERGVAKHQKWLVIIIAAVVLLVVVLVLLLIQGLMARRKNRQMTAVIERLMHYRDIVIQNGDADEMGKNDESDASNEELRRFKEVDKRIMREQLFANPNFGRDDLMRLLGVDKNTLSGLINSTTGTNVPGYINIKRMEYAVQLIKTHPEYTLSSISEACGIKSPATFIRNFKNVYGMTPSDYRQNLQEQASPPQKSSMKWEKIESD